MSCHGSSRALRVQYGLRHRVTNTGMQHSSQSSRVSRPSLTVTPSSSFSSHLVVPSTASHGRRACFPVTVSIGSQRSALTISLCVPARENAMNSRPQRQAAAARLLFRASQAYFSASPAFSLLVCTERVRCAESTLNYLKLAGSAPNWHSFLHTTLQVRVPFVCMSLQKGRFPTLDFRR